MVEDAQDKKAETQKFLEDSQNTILWHNHPYFIIYLILDIIALTFSDRMSSALVILLHIMVGDRNGAKNGVS